MRTLDTKNIAISALEVKDSSVVDTRMVKGGLVSGIENNVAGKPKLNQTVSYFDTFESFRTLAP